jgi:hypothetical protein
MGQRLGLTSKHNKHEKKPAGNANVMTATPVVSHAAPASKSLISTKVINTPALEAQS